MSELATIQRWLTSIIVRPGTLNDKIQLADDHYKLKNERVIRQSGRLASAEKIEIYSRGYFLRLLECIRRRGVPNFCKGLSYSSAAKLIQSI